ncbi:MAG: hypothetical protein IPO92_10355 [Saprospiraceae bacterium]|nr:hypothetical protein [Saprospiraceae bacterium]
MPCTIKIISISISGKYGSCSSRLLIRFDTISVYDLACHQEPKVKKYSKLKITSPINPVIYLNNIESYPDSTYKLASSNGQVVSCFILENGLYDIELKYSNNVYLCIKKSIDLISDINIDVSCDKNSNGAPLAQETFFIKLITPFKITNLSIDNKNTIFNNGPSTIIDGNLTYSAKVKVSKGQHSFSVSDSKTISSALLKKSR